MQLSKTIQYNSNINQVHVVPKELHQLLWRGEWTSKSKNSNNNNNNT